MRTLRRLAPLPVAATAALAFVLLTFPGRSGIAVRVYELVLAAFALAVLVAAVRRARPAPRRSAFELALRRQPQAEATLPEHERAEAHVDVERGRGGERHLVPQPLVRRIAVHLLAARRGVSLDAQPERARALLGDETWELVRADRPSPTDRNARGLRPAQLREIVASLERLA